MIRRLDHAPLVHLELARQSHRNALTLEMLRELKHHLDEIYAQREFRVVVLSGEGEHFCAGADLNWMKSSAEKSLQANAAEAKELFDLLYRMVTMPQVIVCKVKGAVYGGGVGLLAASDLAVADDTTSVCLSEVKLGLTPSMIAPFVIQKVGLGRFKSMALLAPTLNATDAQAAGLIQSACTAAELDGICHTWIKKLLSYGPEALAEVKVLTQFLFEHPHWKTLAEDLPAHIARVRSDPEAQEGMKAFFEKRSPSWAK